LAPSNQVQTENGSAGERRRKAGQREKQLENKLGGENFLIDCECDPAQM
jgi:hypothetical protein